VIQEFGVKNLDFKIPNLKIPNPKSEWEGKQQDASQETCLFLTEYQTFGKKGLGMGNSMLFSHLLETF
jgi:hypothetical protein